MAAIRVTLDRYEQEHAAHIGVRRRLDGIAKERPDRYGKPALNLWGLDIEAAGAELALAKHTGTYWRALAERPEELPGDVGKWQVRYTQRPDGRLIIHKPDKDKAIFVLATGAMPVYYLHGWIRCGDAKRDDWWFEGDGRPAYFVPREALTPPKAGPENPADQASHG